MRSVLAMSHYLIKKIPIYFRFKKLKYFPLSKGFLLNEIYSLKLAATIKPS